MRKALIRVISALCIIGIARAAYLALPALWFAVGPLPTVVVGLCLALTALWFLMELLSGRRTYLTQEEPE